MGNGDRALGNRIRAVRRRANLTQAQLAQRLGISASYLNLIEHGNRALPAGVLIELARQLDVDLASLGPESDLQLECDVREVLSDTLFDEHGLVAADVKELVQASPLVARAVITLYRAYREARATPAREPDDAAPAVPGVSTEEVSDFVQRRSNWFPELEEAATGLWRAADLDTNDLGPRLKRWLADTLGVTIRFEPAGASAFTRRYDPERRELMVSEVLPPRSRHFELAHTIARLQHGDLLDTLARDERLTTDESRALARVVLANWFAGAVLLPYDRLLRAAQEVRYDVELLGHRFRVSWEQVCHRLTTLRRPGAEGVPLHLIRVDVAGNISKRFSASGIQFPRFSGVCARWNVFQAFQTPGMVRTQVSEMPDGTRYFCFSRTVRREAGGYHAPNVLYAIGLGCRVDRARELVYADGVDLEHSFTPIGTSCRTCRRTDCAQRVCPAADHPLALDPNVRGVSLFAPPSR